jgi:hypothetical protein
MSNLIKVLPIVVILAMVSAASCVFYTRSHWWYSVGTAQALTPDGPLGNVTVYKSIDGNLLFWLQEDSLVDQYIFYPSTGKIGIPNFNEFVRLPIFIYAKDIPVPVVFSDDRAKVETDMNIVIEDGNLQFTTLRGRRILADLNGY